MWLEGWLPALWRSSAFRLTLLGVLASLVGALVVFGTVHHAAVVGWHEQIDVRVAEAQTDILGDLRNNGRGLVWNVLTTEAEGGGLFYAALAPNGQWLAGNFRISPALAKHWIGTRTMLGQPGLTLPRHVLALRGVGMRLPNGDRLFIAADASALLSLKSLIARSFTVVFGSILALGLVIGLLTVRATLKRVDQFAITLHEIMEGDLSRRLSIGRAGNEFDRLAEVTNQMLQRIQELMENLRQVTNDISHDLRSPLARLRGHLELSRSRFNDPAFGEMCDVAIKQLDQALGVFSAMLRLAEIEAGARRAQFRPVDLSALLTLLGESFEPVLAERGIALKMDIEAGLRVHGDRELLAQLFSNLLDNIMLHAQGATTATLHAIRREHTIELQVADDGCGIPAEAQSRVLRRFVRLDASRQRPGHGLGLPLAQSVVVLHGGSLGFAKANAGVTIFVTLPAHNG